MKSKLMMAAAMTATLSFMASAAFAEPPEGKGKNKAKKMKDRVEQVDGERRDHKARKRPRGQDGEARTQEERELARENRRNGEGRQNGERRQGGEARTEEERELARENRRNGEGRQDAGRRQEGDKRRDAENRQDNGFTDELRENREGVESKGKGKKKGWFARWREGRANKKNKT